MVVCSMCGRERTLTDPEHYMDGYDYSPIQVVTNRPLGWYSSEKDGEICPECMTKMLANQ